VCAVVRAGLLCHSACRLSVFWILGFWGYNIRLFMHTRRKLQTSSLCSVLLCSVLCTVLVNCQIALLVSVASGEASGSPLLCTFVSLPQRSSATAADCRSRLLFSRLGGPFKRPSSLVWVCPVSPDLCHPVSAPLPSSVFCFVWLIALTPSAYLPPALSRAICGSNLFQNAAAFCSENPLLREHYRLKFAVHSSCVLRTDK